MQNLFEKLIVTLAEAEADFILVGGLSAVLQGAPIVTFDLDICFRRTPENTVRIAKALAPFKPRLRGLDPDLPNIFDEHSLNQGTNFTLEIAGQSVDLLGDMIAIGGYEQVMKNVEEIEVSGFKVKALSLSDLIKTKRAAGRPKDLAAIPHLEATLQAKARQAKNSS